MPKHSFAPDKDIPSQEGKVVLVTGANAGIGKATIHAIALHNPACIYLCARRRSAAESAASELKAQTKYGKIHVLDLDLASLNSVKNCAAEFNAKETRLDLLFLNAGVASTAPALTKEGYEYQFGINHFGHAFLTQLLLPKMMETKRADPKADVRIVVTSSNAAFAPMLPKGGLALEAMRQPDAFSPIGLYAHSKLCNVLFTRKLAQLYPDITITAAHPGVVKSTIWGKGAGGLFSVLYTPIRLATWVSIDEGAKSQLWCGTAPLGGPNGVKSGCYYTPVGQLKEIDKGAAADQKLVDRLWEWTNDKIAIFNKEGQPTA